MASRSLPVSKLKARRRRRRVVLLVVACFLFILLVGGLVGLSWLPMFRIHTVEVTGASSVGSSVIESMVEERLLGTYWGVFPRSNIFFYPKSTIEKELLASFPVFNSVEVRRSNLETINVTVVERTTTALWCGESVVAASACFLLDDNGVAYAPAADFSGRVYLSYYGPVSGTNVKQFITHEEFQALSALVPALEKAAPGETLSRVEVEGADVHITFESGFTLMYSLEDNSADVLERFSLAIKTEPFTKHTLSDFEYLDLRFGDKLYYKLR